MIHKSRNRPRNLRRSVFFMALSIVVLIAAYVIASRYEEASRKQLPGENTMDVGVLKRIEYNGKTYVEKTGITRILLMGIDAGANDRRYGARQGGQADFLMLMVIDHPNDSIHLLQIDRDTITEVETLGILGNPIGTKAMQICLAHSFGATNEDSAQFTKNAVSNLLQGMDIDFYMSLTMDCMQTINSALGGVTVTLEDDFSDIDPEMTKGKTLTLTDRQAEIFMRGRMEVGDGTNNSRMRRHRAFISSASKKFRMLAEEDPTFISEFYDALQAYMTADIKKGRVLNEANRAYKYEILPVQTPDGTYSVGKDGFIEFHVSDGSIEKWIAETMFMIDQ